LRDNGMNMRETIANKGDNGSSVKTIEMSQKRTVTHF